MGKWSVALFGHEKPQYYVQDEKTGLNISSWVDHPGDLPTGMKLHQVVGWEKRAEPGDIIAFKPEKCWNCDEQQHTEIIGMIRDKNYLATKKEEMKALFLSNSNDKSWRPGARFERIWKDRILKLGLHDPQLLPEELRSYFSFLPGASMWHLRGENVWGSAERMRFLVVGLDGIEAEQIQGATEAYFDTESYPEYAPMSKEDFAQIAKIKIDEIDSAYAEYIEMEKQRCSMPADYIKKRRFKIHLDDLSTAGVDVDKMLDPNVKYVPDVGLLKTDCLDKLNACKVQAGAGMSVIKPIYPIKVVL